MSKNIWCGLLCLFFTCVINASDRNQRISAFDQEVLKYEELRKKIFSALDKNDMQNAKTHFAEMETVVIIGMQNQLNFASSRTVILNDKLEDLTMIKNYLDKKK